VGIGGRVCPVASAGDFNLVAAAEDLGRGGGAVPTVSGRPKSESLPGISRGHFSGYVGAKPLAGPVAEHIGPRADGR